MPEEDPTTDYIMVATGTGIAPFRGFVRRLFFEETPAADVYKGQAWLFLGVANSDLRCPPLCTMMNSKVPGKISRELPYGLCSFP